MAWVDVTCSREALQCTWARTSSIHCGIPTPAYGNPDKHRSTHPSDMTDMLVQQHTASALARDPPLQPPPPGATKLVPCCTLAQSLHELTAPNHPLVVSGYDTSLWLRPSRVVRATPTCRHADSQHPLAPLAPLSPSLDPPSTHVMFKGSLPTPPTPRHRLQARLPSPQSHVPHLLLRKARRLADAHSHGPSMRSAATMAAQAARP